MHHCIFVVELVARLVLVFTPAQLQEILNGSGTYRFEKFKDNALGLLFTDLQIQVRIFEEILAFADQMDVFAQSQLPIHLNLGLIEVTEFVKCPFQETILVAYVLDAALAILQEHKRRLLVC